MRPFWTRTLGALSLRGAGVGPPLRCGHLLGVLQGERCMRWSVAVRFRSHSEPRPGELARGVAQVWVRGAGYRHLPVTVAAYGPGALGVWVCCPGGDHAAR